MPEFPFLFASPWPWWLLVCAAGGAGLLTWRGYRHRKGEIKAPLRRWLLCLRWAGWGLLFVCLLQPTYRMFVPEKHASRVTVLVDDSESMSFTDGTKLSRLERVRAALGRANNSAGLLGKLGHSFQVKLEAFAGGARMIEAPEELAAQGERTDLAKSLAEAFARLKGPDAAGLVLVSDGADTARGDLARVAQLFRRAGVPIYALGVGSRDVADLSITQVRCRRAVSKDTLARVEVDVARVNAPAGAYAVRIVRQGRTVKETSVNLNSEKGTVVFELLPETQGFQEYEAVVEPYVGEQVTANNTLAFGFVAFSRKLRVLYMEGSNLWTHGQYGRPYWHTRWEHEFLKDALEEDRDVEVDMLFKEYPADYAGKIKTVKEGYPRTKKELYAYDVIVNSDIPYAHFNEDQVKWTVDFVGKHGGGFCMVGGYDAYGEGGYAKTPFDRMLPVEMNAHDTHADNKDFRWRLTDEGLRDPIFQIDKDPKKNRESWEQLNTLGFGGGPSFHGYSKTTRHKPAAKVLAVIDEEDDPGTYMGPMILVAVQPFGRGYSMAFTTDCTGGWGAEWEDSWGDDLRDPDRRNIYYKTFWKNTLRWLAQYRVQAPNQLVQIETGQLVYGRGENPDVRVKVLTEDYEPTHDARVEISVTDPKGAAHTFQLYPRYEEPGVYERKLELPLVGRYELEAVAALRGDEAGRDKTVLQIRPATEELRKLGQDEEALRKLAEASGGEYLPLEEAGHLGELLRKDTHVIPRHRDWDLWDNGWFFAAIILFLCGEWFFRKRAGLP